MVRAQPRWGRAESQPERKLIVFSEGGGRERQCEGTGLDRSPGDGVKHVLGSPQNDC